MFKTFEIRVLLNASYWASLMVQQLKQLPCKPDDLVLLIL